MNDQHLIEKRISSEQIFAGNFMKVIRDTVKLPDGREAKREYIKHSGAVAVFALDKNNNVVMERQYRTPVSQVMIEVPAGKIDAGEDYLACGKRELLEETGYVSDNWECIGEILPCIGYSNEKIVFFIARDAVFTEAKLDEGEFLEVYTQPLNELLNDAYSGKITDGKTLAGLLLLNGYLSKNK